MPRGFEVAAARPEPTRPLGCFPRLRVPMADPSATPSASPSRVLTNVIYLAALTARLVNQRRSGRSFIVRCSFRAARASYTATSPARETRGLVHVLLHNVVSDARARASVFNVSPMMINFRVFIYRSSSVAGASSETRSKESRDSRDRTRQRTAARLSPPLSLSIKRGWSRESNEFPK